MYYHESPRAFNGDGYSISVYELPGSIRDRFESPDEGLLANFPQRPSYRNDWSAQRWKRSPFDDEFDEYLDFALSSYDSDKMTGIYDQFDAIRKAPSGGEAYYAFFYCSHKEYLLNVDMFIIDLGGNRLYTINHNT